MTDTILLPVSGDERGYDERVETAVRRAERDDATVHGLYVVDTGRFGEPALSTAEIVVDDREDEGKRLLSRVADRCGERGVAVETRCCHGRPNEELVAYAEAIDADVAVLGDRRRPRKTLDALEAIADEIATPSSPAVGR